MLGISNWMLEFVPFRHSIFPFVVNGIHRATTALTRRQQSLNQRCAHDWNEISILECIVIATRVFQRPFVILWLDRKLKSLHRSDHHPIECSRREIQITKLIENGRDEKDEIDESAIRKWDSYFVDSISVEYLPSKVERIAPHTCCASPSYTRLAQTMATSKERRQFVISSNGWENISRIDINDAVRCDRRHSIRSSQKLNRSTMLQIGARQQRQRSGHTHAQLVFIE